MTRRIDMNLETKFAPEIIHMLEKEQNSGSLYVVFEMRPMDLALRPSQLDFFKTLEEALDRWEDKGGYGYLPGGEEYPVFYRPIDQMLNEIKQANPLTTKLNEQLTPPIQAKAAIDNQLNSKTMNLNNLEDLRKEIKELGFNPKVADELEKNMQQLPGYFTLKDQFPGDKGLVDMTLHFRKSGQSDFYNFNKFDATAGKVPPTVDNQHYMVLTENNENKEKPLVKHFDSPNEAIEFFKKQKGTSELALGESPESKQMLASKEDGKVNYINKDFRSAYFSPAIKQTFYLKEGNGFTARQAANMVQGRTVYRDNMLSSLGEPYKAWIRLDFDQKKDDYGNYKLKQFHHPTYGFDLGKTLSDYRIKDMADPAKKEGIMEAMRHGDRVQVTALDKENKEIKVLTEAVPRYGKLDFYNEAGIRQKREQFEKPAMTMEIPQGKGQGKTKEKELDESKSISVR